MKTNVDNMLDSLSPVIDQKCMELRAARKERLQSRMFVVMCIMILLIPALLIFAGISLVILIAPLAFMSLSLLLLLPVLISGNTSNQGGHSYEQA